MAEFVEFSGESVVGDGWSFIYEDGKYVHQFEYGEDVGYLMAKKEDGHSVRSIRLDEGESGLDYEGLYDWWAENSNKTVTEILAAAEVAKLEVEVSN